MIAEDAVKPIYNETPAERVAGLRIEREDRATAWFSDGMVSSATVLCRCGD
jgi:hypothetical protein